MGSAICSIPACACSSPTSAARVSATLQPLENVPLASRCTMGVGGSARFFIEASDEARVAAAVRWAESRGVPIRILGGGSNVVVADDGLDGLVVKIGLRGVSSREVGDSVEVSAAAGEPWDPFVERAVAHGWAGLECLSGIPGLVGATPIQNVGAYGREVSQTVTAVRVLDRRSGEIVMLAAGDCRFGYRTSRFKSGEPDRFVVLAVTYRLSRDGVPTVRYADLERDLEARGITRPSLTEVRKSVLTIRRSKSMVLDPDDPNRRSCGSFFLNPIVDAATLARVERAVGDAAMPRWPEAGGQVKLSAAWLIERAGFRRGDGPGPVTLSTRHSLAIVCREGARAADVAAFARGIRARVEARFGVRLELEPVLWGGLSVEP
jgi:UDP-N-acetylmuramate dehydrogenase